MRALLRNEQGLEDHETIDAEEVDPGYKDQSIFLSAEPSYDPPQECSKSPNVNRYDVQKNLLTDLVDDSTEKSGEEPKRPIRMCRTAANKITVEEKKLLNKTGKIRSTAKANKRAGGAMESYYKSVKIPRAQLGSGAQSRLFSSAVHKWETFCK